MLWLSITHAATLTVGPEAQYASLEEALNDAEDLDRLEIAPGTYDGSHVIDQTLTLAGSTDGVTRITGSGENVIRVTSGTLTLEDLVVDGEVERRGILVASTAAMAGSNLTVENGFDALNEGGACIRAEDESAVWLIDSTIRECSGGDFGAGVRALGGADLLISGTLFENGAAGNAGGAIAIDSANATIDGTTFQDNTAGGAGGAIQLFGPSTLVVTDSVFQSNQALVGGAIALDGEESVTITNTLFVTNTAMVEGGAIAGGGSDTALDGVRFEQNTATSHGGAIAAYQGTWDIVNAFFCQNEAAAGTQGVTAWPGLVSMRIDNALWLQNGNGSSGALLQAEVDTTVLHNTILEDDSTTGLHSQTVDFTVEDTVFANYPHEAVGFSMGLSGNVSNNLFDGPVQGPGVDNALQLIQNAGILGSTDDCSAGFLAVATAGIDDTLSIRVDLDDTPADLGHFGGPRFDPSFWAADADGDGFFRNVDCDEENPLIYPGADEACDGIDTDCDGTIESPTDVYDDEDQDGYGDPNTGRTVCIIPLDAILNGDDCDDTDAAIHPAAVEACPDEIDNDCDELIDAEDPDYTDEAVIFSLDGDSDGVGNGIDTIEACSGDEPNDHVPDAIGVDCDDNNPLISPLLGEICDGLDNNCDNVIDEGFPSAPYWPDEDLDGFGFGALPTISCEPLLGQVSNNDDCNDNDPLLAPGMAEVCDGVDNDCDSLIDDGLQQFVWFPDLDGDGFGDGSSTPTTTCDTLPGSVEDSTDCDDSQSSVNPAAPEVPDDGIDNDCVGGDEITPVLDSDGDGVPDAIDPVPFSEHDGIGDSPEAAFGWGCATRPATSPPWLATLALFLRRRRA